MLFRRPPDLHRKICQRLQLLGGRRRLLSPSRFATNIQAVRFVFTPAPYNYCLISLMNFNKPPFHTQEDRRHETTTNRKSVKN